MTWLLQNFIKVENEETFTWNSSVALLSLTCFIYSFIDWFKHCLLAVVLTRYLFKTLLIHMLGWAMPHSHFLAWKTQVKYYIAKQCHTWNFVFCWKVPHLYFLGVHWCMEHHQKGLNYSKWKSPSKDKFRKEGKGGFKYYVSVFWG